LLAPPVAATRDPQIEAVRLDRYRIAVTTLDADFQDLGVGVDGTRE
jgi:hypothetical protein